MDSFSNSVSAFTALVGAVATILGVIVVIRSRQLARPALRLHFGQTGLDPDRRKYARKGRKRLIVYGLPSIRRDHFVLPLAIPIENVSSIAATSLSLQVELPVHYLAEGEVVVDDDGTAYQLGPFHVSGRTANRFRSSAQVKIDINVLGPKGSLVFHELVRIPASGVMGMEEDRHQNVMARRWQGCPNFHSAFHIQIVLSAANCEPQSLTGVIAAVRADTEEELTRVADDLIKRTWDSWKRSSGIAGLVWRWQKRSLSEFAELVLLRQDALETKPVLDVDPTILKNSRTAILQFIMPPWGLTGEPVPVRGLRPPTSAPKPDG